MASRKIASKGILAIRKLAVAHCHSTEEGSDLSSGPIAHLTSGPRLWCWRQKVQAESFDV